MKQLKQRTRKNAFEFRPLGFLIGKCVDTIISYLKTKFSKNFTKTFTNRIQGRLKTLKGFKIF